jgi:hypothetical protein
MDDHHFDYTQKLFKKFKLKENNYLGVRTETDRQKRIWWFEAFVT